MGDYWNNSGWYEQQKALDANREAEREQARADMVARQDEMRQHMYDQQREDDWRRRQNSISGYSGSSTASAVGWTLGRFFATPLIQVGNGPALLTRGIFISAPLAIAALYFFRSVAYWIPITIAVLLLILASPLLVRIFRTIFRIVLILAIVLVVIVVLGFIFHWWH